MYHASYLRGGSGEKARVTWGKYCSLGLPPLLAQLCREKSRKCCLGYPLQATCLEISSSFTTSVQPGMNGSLVWRSHSQWPSYRSTHCDDQSAKHSTLVITSLDDQLSVVLFSALSEAHDMCGWQSTRSQTTRRYRSRDPTSQNQILLADSESLYSPKERRRAMGFSQQSSKGSRPLRRMPLFGIKTMACVILLALGSGPVSTQLCWNTTWMSKKILVCKLFRTKSLRRKSWRKWRWRTRSNFLQHQNLTQCAPFVPMESQLMRIHQP